MYINGLLIRYTGKSNPMYGKKSWNSGLNKYEDIRIYNYGIKISNKKKIEWGLKTDDEKKIITDRLNYVMIQNRAPTKIELKINEFLTSLNLKFKQNKRLNGFLVDFYLFDYDIVIECDGDYWHGNPKFYNEKTLNNVQLKNIERDYRKNIMLTENKIKYLRLWEHDIHINFEYVKESIIKLISIENTSDINGL